MAPLKVEKKIELKCSADQFYNVFRKTPHHILNHCPTKFQKVHVHEGDWETPGSIKIWHYTIGGKEEVFKERVELDDEKKTITLVGLEGDVLKKFKSYTNVWELKPKDNGCLVNCIIYYEKFNETDPDPQTPYLDYVIELTQEIDAGLTKAS